MEELLLSETLVIDNYNISPKASRDYSKESRMMNDEALHEHYLELIDEHWENIQMMYRFFAGKKPVMQFDVEKQQIAAYPYKEFKAQLSQRSQASLTKQYRAANANNQMVVFVRDNERQKLVSYTLDVEM